MSGGNVPVISINKIDWFRILADLSRKGYSLQGIAEELDVVASTLVGWKKGASPRHHTGEALIEMWCCVTGRTRQDVPREKVMQKFILHPASHSGRHSEK